MLALCVLSLGALAAPTDIGLAAPTITVLHGFRLDYKDGYSPRAPLVQASDGNLYGTTLQGGDDGSGCTVHSCKGTVFTLTPQGQFRSLHTFLSPYADGSSPWSGLVEGSDGYLYGTTYDGGATGAGTIYKINKSGEFHKLHDFCQPRALCTKEGASPRSGLVVGRDGNLYGRTTWAGPGGGGTIFRVTPSGDFATIFSFNGATTGGGGTGGLVQASDGNLYGNTRTAVFRVTPAGQGTVLYHFDPSKDGAGAGDALIQAADGNMYGLTEGPGAIFRISLDGKYQRVHLLNPAVEGFGPNTLVQTKDGNLWGSTTNTGPANGGGAVFTVTTAGTLVQSTFLDVRQTGVNSLAPLIQASDGKLYGTTSSGGSTPDGKPATATVFVIDPGGNAPPAPANSGTVPTTPSDQPPAPSEAINPPASPEAPTVTNETPVTPPDATPPSAEDTPPQTEIVQPMPDLTAGGSLGEGDAQGAPETLTDDQRADILSAVDRANAVWVQALQTLDSSVLRAGVAGQLLNVDLAEVDQLRRKAQTMKNINTAFTVASVTLDTPGHAVVQTSETWYAETYDSATGGLLERAPSATYAETYTVEYLNGGWIVTRNDV